MFRSVIPGLLIAAGVAVHVTAAPVSDPSEPSAGPSASEPAASEVARQAENNLRFASDFYRQLRSRPGNLAFSPVGLASGLSMAYAGARGDTAAELARVMHFAANGVEHHRSFQSLLQTSDDVSDDDARPALVVANGLWFQKGHEFRPGYAEFITRYYGAAVGKLDFEGRAAESLGQINKWVAEQTAGKIPELLDAQALFEDSRLVLANAIYFRAPWSQPFDAKKTASGTFYLNDKDTVETDMMHQVGRFRIAQDDSVTILELPYKGQRYAMLLLIPQSPNGIADLEQQLTLDRIASARSKLEMKTVDLSLPKFTIDAGIADTIRIFRKLGLSLCFSRDADFSAMTDSQELFISNITHRARVEVDEAGTIGAAATGVAVASKGVPKVVLVDRPFLFLVQDHQLHRILFWGRCADPRK